MMNPIRSDNEITIGTSVVPKNPYLNPEIIYTMGLILETACQKGGSIDIA